MRWGTAKEYVWYYKTLKFDGYRFLVWLKEGNADLHQLVLKELEHGNRQGNTDAKQETKVRDGRNNIQDGNR
jgi:hypothetical protein